MRLTLLFLISVLISLSFTGCKKDSIACPDQIIINFEGSKYVYDENGYPVSWNRVRVNKSYGDDSGVYTYNADGLPVSITSNYEGGYSWVNYAHDWDGDTCHVTYSQEGPFEPSYFTFVINEKREIIKYDVYDYYYSGGQLDSIIGGGILAKRYFTYSRGLLSSVVAFGAFNEQLYVNTYTYNDQGLLQEELFEAANGDKVIRRYDYLSQNKLKTFYYEELNSLKPNVFKQADVLQQGCKLPMSLDPIARIKFAYFRANPLRF